MLTHKHVMALLFGINVATILSLQKHCELTKSRFDLIENIERDRKRSNEEYINDMIEEKMMQISPRK